MEEEVKKNNGTNETPAKGRSRARAARSGPRLLPIILAALIAAGIAGAYAYGAYYYSVRFLPNTYAAGADISGLTVPEAEALLFRRESIKSMELKGRAFDEKLDLTGAEVYVSYYGFDEALSSQGNLAWPYACICPNTVELPYTITYSEEGLLKSMHMLRMLESAFAVPPSDAYIYYDPYRNEHVVIEEDEGSEIDEEKLMEAITRAVAGGVTELDLEECGVYLEPMVRQDNPELIREANILFTLDTAYAALDMGADTFVNLHGGILLGFMTADYEPDESLIESYVAELEEKYNTYYKDENRTIINHAGIQKEIPSEYGWQLDAGDTFDALLSLVTEISRERMELINEASQSTVLLDGIRVGKLPGEYDIPPESVADAPEAGGTGGDEGLMTLLVIDGDGGETCMRVEATPTEEAPVTVTGEVQGDLNVIQAVWKKGAASHGEADYGGTYVEIDMGEQTVYVYEDYGLVLETPCVTGLMTVKGRRTPEGIYTINYKQRSRYLTGYNSDGTVSYMSYVNYWMPFKGGVGLHDATWRKAFGGDIYLTDGSHGCVNLEKAAAAEIYEVAYVGMPVICYY